MRMMTIPPTPQLVQRPSRVFEGLFQYGSLWLLLVVLAGCSASPDLRERSADAHGVVDPADAACPATRPWDGIAPEVRDEERALEYWLNHPDFRDTLDDVLLTEAQIQAHNAAMLSQQVNGEPLRMDLARTLDRSLLEQELAHRLRSLKRSFAADIYVLADATPAKDTLTNALAGHEVIAETFQHVVAAGDVHVRCAPVIHSFYTKTLDLAFDRNNCSVLKEGEPFVIVNPQSSPRLIRAGFTMGWIADDAPHTPPVDAELFARYVRAPQARVSEESRTVPRPNATLRLDAESLAEGTPLVAGWRATSEALEPVQALRANLDLQAGPLTRRAWLTEAFSYLGEEYGWGGREGFRDCSRFLMDSLNDFGMLFPRHSAIQQYAGDFWVDLAGAALDQKLAWMDEANKRGVVLLHMNGHIMLYLGRSRQGEPLVLHSYAEFVEPCEEGNERRDGGNETLVVVNRVDLSTLSLGAGTSRTSFLERLDRLTVIGGTPGPALEGMAKFRQAAPVNVPRFGQRCDDSPEQALFTAPFHAHRQTPTTLIYTAETDPGPVSMTLVSERGETMDVAFERRVGPPYTLIARVELPSTGTWRLAAGEGTNVLACREFRVREKAQRQSVGGEVVWPVRNAWNRRFENLYSVFIHELTRYALEDAPTWNNLQQLLVVQDKNILWNYLGADEESSLVLQPDCADFPYVTRAYFAWKMGLPFGYRSCNRGREGRPPTCGEVQTNLQERALPRDELEFNRFGRRVVMSGVHSGNGRTHPDDDQTDLYPVALSRDALRPGVVYADPDGHVMMIAGWIPQPAEGYGVMYAADAQPDGTIGLRRFWRGTFGFRPETTSVGAGFKAFRPIVRGGDSYRALSNEELKTSSVFTPFSRQQYEGSTNDFYDTMDALIHPRALDPVALQESLIDALEQSVQARVHSVKFGVDTMRARRWPKVEMPTGYSIFETSGLWEDFATPSRDMRLLLAIDATMQLVDHLRRSPEHFGLQPDAVEPAIDALVAARDASLARRSVGYERSDGSVWTLTLLDVVRRASAFEVAYNINDCAEHRWGAAEGSDEASTCAQRAPLVQQERMEDYRRWFAARQRPGR